MLAAVAVPLALLAYRLLHTHSILRNENQQEVPSVSGFSGARARTCG